LTLPRLARRPQVTAAAGLTIGVLRTHRHDLCCIAWIRNRDGGTSLAATTWLPRRAPKPEAARQTGHARHDFLTALAAMDMNLW